MTERLLTHLRHVDLAVPDYDKQLDFYAGVWGLTKVSEDTGIAFLAAEGSPEQYVVRLRRSDDKRLDLVSYGAASTAAPSRSPPTSRRGSTAASRRRSPSRSACRTSSSTPRT
jgi:catechol 2,3-dioxygenase-like lactoylglutathione lyase family enzyme